jgi:hypothetical protein
MSYAVLMVFVEPDGTPEPCVDGGVTPSEEMALTSPQRR